MHAARLPHLAQQQQFKELRTPDTNFAPMLVTALPSEIRQQSATNICSILEKRIEPRAPMHDDLASAIATFDGEAAAAVLIAEYKLQLELHEGVQCHIVYLAGTFGCTRSYDGLELHVECCAVPDDELRWPRGAQGLLQSINMWWSSSHCVWYSPSRASTNAHGRRK